MKIPYMELYSAVRSVHSVTAITSYQVVSKAGRSSVLRNDCAGLSVNMDTKNVLIFCCLLLLCSAECPNKCRCLGTWAKCQNGKLEDISTDFPLEVTTLTLTHFDLQTLEPGALASLSVSSRLWKLELYQGNLETIKENAFEGLGALESLYITQNKLKNIETGAFRGLSNLTMLDLSHNELASLPSNIFQGLDNILKIFLNDNKQLRTLNLEAFDRLLSLEELSAKDCGIEALLPMVSRSTTSIDLDLRLNPVKCDCSLKTAVSVLRNVLGACGGRDIKEVLDNLSC